MLQILLIITALHKPPMMVLLPKAYPRTDNMCTKVAENIAKHAKKGVKVEAVCIRQKTWEA